MDVDESETDEDDFIDDDDDDRPKKAKSTKKPPPKKKATPAKPPKKEVKDETPGNANAEEAKPKPKNKYVAIPHPDNKAYFADVGCSFAAYAASKAAGPKNPGGKTIPEGAYNCLADLTLVFTGELETLGRDEAIDLAKRYGA